MLTGRKYRLDFTPEQGEFAERIGGACRSVWNTALEQRRIYRRRGGWIGYHDQARQVAEAKDDFPWLAEVPGHCLQQALIDLDQACARHGTWKVRWKSKVANPPSFRFPEGGKITVERLNRRWARVKLPKLGWVRFRLTRPLGGKAKNATVSRDGEHWYISFLVEDAVTPPERHADPGSAVGIDRGVVKVVTRSDGRFHHRVFARDREVEHAKKLQRDFVRTAKGSARRKEAAGRVAAMARKVRRRREDFAAKTAHTLATGFEMVVFEALTTKNMTAGVEPRPDPEQPGAFLPNGAAAKTGLNRSILDKGWYRIELATRSRARYTGTHVITVNPAYTSQTCNVCTVVDRKSRESQAVFRCTSCGHIEHADVNAAKNVLTAGRAEFAQPRPGVRAGARKPRNRVGRKANRQATAAQSTATAGSGLAGIPRL
ncbi:RNA-guided endonuclease InsQ/TnpB family protein [Streptosporangium roseum]|uniref:IS605 family transposase OrfB n=1 Tax=Streptosporangium roseum (strain ATCC 12428 / DSM 43021 / JCM 3005 / KCTC 9067 / NCIMB 10171 / NRRL 2505 / NI 9100) TaxID=479432 RepID=D2ATJ7_STRRD|nr:RNA-guided endonuclease TnpB family protein [Streptosporangium roseum]ACZ86717.1 IS605 family transposase OrfB [Streptosporangium roseum DSM 43021]